MEFVQINFEVTWLGLPKDGRSISYSRTFNVDLHNKEYRKPLTSLESADWNQFSGDFFIKNCSALKTRITN